MARRPRLNVPGVPWHIIQRSNDRMDCFCAEDDYLFYLAILQEQALQSCCAIHAYVLMKDHVHLLVTPKEERSAALLMKHLSQRYVHYFNRTYQRRGRLWGGRFRSCLIQYEEYVLSCYRYIELNPMRADIVTLPGDYRWSSFHANGGCDAGTSTLLTPHPEYINLGASPSERQRAYRSLCLAQLSPERISEIRNATNGNFVLGSQGFQQYIAHRLNRRVTPGKSGRPTKYVDVNDSN